LLRDHRPYILKRMDILFQLWYARHFLRPAFDFLGEGALFMKPWHVEVFGGPISLGRYANVIATPDKKVRLTVWSGMGEKGSIAIGDYVLICPGVRILAAREIRIGSSCMFAQSALVTDSDWHGIYDRAVSVGRSEPVAIGENVWIGDSAMVGKGVTIGDNSIVGAGAVVVRDVPANVVVAGNPATVVKELDAAREMRTRADWFADPRHLAAQFDEIDRHMMKGNTWLGWLRSVFFPRRGD